MAFGSNPEPFFHKYFPNDFNLPLRVNYHDTPPRREHHAIEGPIPPPSARCPRRRPVRLAPAQKGPGESTPPSTRPHFETQKLESNVQTFTYDSQAQLVAASGQLSRQGAIEYHYDGQTRVTTSRYR